MSSKKFQNRTCIYCTTAPSTTADHVIARQLVPAAHRGNLPKVPACQSCNNAKSHLEHYLATVLPFASRLKSSKDELSQHVPKRLAKNAKLHRELEAGRSRVWTQESSGIIVPAMTVPFDGEKLDAYVGYLVRGLMWHHWQVTLGAEHFIEVGCLTTSGMEFFDIMSGWRSRNRVDASIADGVLNYTALQGADQPEVSIWILTLLGGLKVTAEDASIQATRWGVLTGPLKMQEEARRNERELAALYASGGIAAVLDRRPR